jgi:hypothetical protein
VTRAFLIDQPRNPGRDLAELGTAGSQNRTSQMQNLARVKNQRITTRPKDENANAASNGVGSPILKSSLYLFSHPIELISSHAGTFNRGTWKPIKH